MPAGARWMCVCAARRRIMATQQMCTELLPASPTNITLDSVQGTNVHVVGFSDTNASIVKLGGDGSTKWEHTTRQISGPDVSETVLVDDTGSAYVVGTAAQEYLRPRPEVGLVFTSYSPSGVLLTNKTLQPPLNVPYHHIKKTEII